MFPGVQVAGKADGIRSQRPGGARPSIREGRAFWAGGALSKGAGAGFAQGPCSAGRGSGGVHPRVLFAQGERCTPAPTSTPGGCQHMPVHCRDRQGAGLPCAGAEGTMGAAPQVRTGNLGARVPGSSGVGCGGHLEAAGLSHGHGLPTAPSGPSAQSGLLGTRLLSGPGGGALSSQSGQGRRRSGWMVSCERGWDGASGSAGSRSP